MRLSVVDQVTAALKPQNRVATALGPVLGGFVPAATYFVSRHEVHGNPYLWPLVIGGLVYSATTVYTWGKRAFGSTAKSIGFVVLLEGILVFAASQALSVASLSVLVAINAIATGSQLSLDRREAKAALVAASQKSRRR